MSNAIQINGNLSNEEREAIAEAISRVIGRKVVKLYFGDTLTIIDIEDEPEDWLEDRKQILKIIQDLNIRIGNIEVLLASKGIK